MKFAAIIGTSLLFNFTSNVLAADASHCVSIDDGDSRLSCYDLEYGRNVSVQKGQGDWIVRSKKNPLDDSQTTAMVLESEQGTSRWGKPVVLVIRCQSNTTEMWINWRDYLGRDGPRITTRVGDTDAVTSRWSSSSDNSSSFYPRSPIGFIKKMMGAERFVAQTTPYNENPVTAVFNITGLEEAITPLRQNCNW